MKISLWYALKIIFMALFVWGVILAAFVLIVPANGEYPDRPITLMVVAAPGVAKDTTVRALIKNANSFRATIIISNKPGAGGSLAVSKLYNSRSDGYTLLAGDDGALISTSLLQGVPYNPVTDFTYVMGYAIGGRGAILVRNDSPWKTLKDFIDYARKNPGKVVYSSAEYGSTLHLMMEIIARKEKLELVHVPCKGSFAARAALTSGTVDLCSSGADWINYVGPETGIRPLASLSEVRIARYPNVPCIKELGYEPLLEVWNITGPKGLYPDVVKRINDIFTELANNPNFKVDAEKINVIPSIMSGNKLNDYIRHTWNERENFYKELGLIPK
jgi:tripartite-type tricarboxylate transporter receptor subunit TctC